MTTTNQHNAVVVQVKTDQYSIWVAVDEKTKNIVYEEYSDDFPIVNNQININTGNVNDWDKSKEDNDYNYDYDDGDNDYDDDDYDDYGEDTNSYNF